MSAIDKRVQELAFRAVAKIGELAKSGKVANAALALTVIEGIVKAVLAARRREITPAELEAELAAGGKAFDEKIAANKKTIQSELDKKFDSGSGLGPSRDIDATPSTKT